MAGLLTRPGHRAFPVLHQWQKFDVRFCGLTAAGTVPDFHRVPFSFGRRKPPETISRLQNYLYYITTVQRNYPIGSVDLNRNHSSDVLV